MDTDSCIILMSVTSLVLILTLNSAFPPFAIVASQEIKTTNWSNAGSVFDRNSTVYGFNFVYNSSDYTIETQKTQPSQPSGWFNLTLKDPFEIYNNWTRIYLRALFYTGTEGGCIYWWTLNWRLHNDAVTPLSDSWDFSHEASAYRQLMGWRDNIEYYLNRDEWNSSIYTPGQWWFEATLTVHNAIIKPPQPEYENCYDLILEVSEETSTPKNQITFANSIYPTLTAEATLAAIVVIEIIKKRKHSRSLETASSKIIHHDPK